MTAKHSVSWLGVALASLFGSASCAEELTLPDGQARPNTELLGGAPSDGITGADGGTPDTAPISHVQLPDSPRYTTFGGAGGEAGDEMQADLAAGGRAGPATKGGARGGGGSAAQSGGGAANTGGQGGAEALPAPTSSELYFSEYLEGSGSLKALELYAASASSLEGCELLTYFNGKLEPSRLALHGSVAEGDVYVLCSTALASAQPERCDRSTSLTFNGNDALALACQGLTLDVIGQIGVDPGAAWGTGATADHTLRRQCSVLGGRSDGSAAFDPSVEWSTFGVDTFSDLGVRACATP